jgi:hypothetical protein
MKLTKTQWIVVAVVAGVAIWYFFLRKKDEGTKKESGYTNFDLDGGQLEAGYYGIMGFSGNETGYNETDLGANIQTETGYMASEVGPGIESGYGLFGKFCRDGQTYNPVTKKCEDASIYSSYTRPQPVTAKKTLYNTGQICRKDNQCGGGLKCINGRCQPVSIPRPVAPTKPTTTDLFPVFPKPTTTLTSTPRGGLTETLSGTTTGTGVVSPTTSTGSVPRTLSGAMGMTVETGYMM